MEINHTANWPEGKDSKISTGQQRRMVKNPSGLYSMGLNSNGLKTQLICR
jgi:hypothetical protein